MLDKGVIQFSLRDGGLGEFHGQKERDRSMRRKGERGGGGGESPGTNIYAFELLQS